MTPLVLPSRKEYDSEVDWNQACHKVRQKESLKARLWFAGVILGIFVGVAAAMWTLVAASDWLALYVVHH